MKKQMCPVCHVSDYKRKIGQYFVCASCSTLYLYPTPKDIPQYVLEQQAQEHIAIPPDPKIIKIHEQRVRALSKYLKSGASILDFGCGRGDFLFQARKAGFKVYGIDKSVTIVKYLNSQGLRVYTSLNKLPIKFFDAITAFDVVEHLSNPQLFIRQIAARLKSNGVVMITTPNALGVSGRILRSKWWVFGPANHLSLFNIKSLRVLLENEGFEVIDTRTNTFTLWFSPPDTLLRRIINKSVYLLFNLLSFFYLLIISVTIYK